MKCLCVRMKMRLLRVVLVASDLREASEALTAAVQAVVGIGWCLILLSEAMTSVCLNLEAESSESSRSLCL